MIVNQYNNFYTNEVSRQVADELIARMDALSALNRNVSDFGSSKQFFSVRSRESAKPELLRKFQEWQNRKIAYGEVRAFRRVSECCQGLLVKNTEQAPFVITVDYSSENGTVPGTGTDSVDSGKSYGDIKYSVSDGLNKPSFYNGQPQAFLQSVNVSNEGYGGVVQRVTIKMRVFTREAFEIIDKWFLRPGNEMLVKYGWSVPLTSLETSSDTIHAVIFNFNASLTDDMGWLITVYGIAKGNIAVGLALGSSAEETAALNNNTNQPNIINENVIPNLTTILKDELNKIRVGFPGISESDVTNVYDNNVDLDSDNKPYGVIYESDIFPHGMGRIKFSVENTPQETGILPSTTSPIIFDAAEERRQASDAELDTWLTGFRTSNPKFVEFEKIYGQKSPQAFVEFYKGNFGIVDEGFFSNTMWPDRSQVLLTERFINGRNPEQTEPTQDETQAGKLNRQEIFYKTAADVAGTRTVEIAVENQTNLNNSYVAVRPPFGPLRRKVLNIMYQSLPDDRTEEQKNLEQQIAAQIEQQQNALQQQVEGQQDGIPTGVYANTRITDPTSTTRYFICLGDLVYFFNEKVLKQAPELYTAVQLLVENQPTSYDPNLVSCMPSDIIFSNARNTQGGMSAYGAYNSINYGFKYRKKAITNELETAFGCDGVDFYPEGEFNSKDDMPNHREDWGIYLNENDGEKIAAFNIAHIWISIDVISEIYMNVLKDKAIDPQYRTIFDFFEGIFSTIAQASAGAIQLTLTPDSNQLYSNKTSEYSSLSLENPLLKKTQLFRIVDTNFQVPHNLPGAPRSFDFKVNDVNATILRDVNVSLKLPSKLQTVAYTYGRSGLNEDIVDIDDSIEGGSGICQQDYNKLIQKRDDILRKLYAAKDDVANNLSADNVEKLINALAEYVKNPTPIASDATDTSRAVSTHQGWIYSKLYPVELQFKLDGIAGFLYGNKVNVLNALPSRYSDRIYFTLVKIEHEIQNNDWITTLTAIARLKNSNGLIQFPKVITTDTRPDLCDQISTNVQNENVNTETAADNEVVRTSQLPGVTIPRPIQQDNTAVRSPTDFQRIP
jgi:hypothetical protein